MTYEDFVGTRLQALMRYAVMLTGDPHLAQDLVQETMVRAQLKWRRVARADAPESYVKRMMVNLYLDWRRGSWFQRVFLRADVAEARPVPNDHAEDGADRDQMWRALARLPRQQRAALVLRYYEDLADVQVADILGCTVGTARGYISRALATLRAEVAEELITGVNR
ncbi:SigE family RNA polymerase sigma factor [Allorhizocola rhizosphaerae]|uniref:SigE family RNA polymerase sigma factor n=1 Tax=Allorhizocola rhizosphaerae TaxID=1872709 RepID=UPI000E3E147B|nr:SigE family RNA polymerase sigma factor [Allorhizocola rhizosphaerae]